MKNVRDQYLEFRYGLRPLYYDLKGVHDYLKKEVCHDRQTSRGKRVDEYVTAEDFYQKNSFYVNPYSTIPSATGIFHRKASVKVTCSSGYLYAFQFADNITRYLAELGIDRPISTMWELIPFSFMIDWFANVGDVIRAWEPKPHCSTLSSWCTTTTTLSSTITPTSCRYLSMGYKSRIVDSGLATPSVASVQLITKHREPSPQVVILPTFDINLSSVKLLDMAAIFHGLRESKRRQGWL